MSRTFKSLDEFIEYHKDKNDPRYQDKTRAYMVGVRIAREAARVAKEKQ